jgi:hypothetical protein
MAQKDPGFSRMNKDGLTLEHADFDKNPLSFFTNRRATWFDDYTKYRPYESVPSEIPLFQFPMPAGTSLEAAGTHGLSSHGLNHRRQQQKQQEQQHQQQQKQQERAFLANAHKLLRRNGSSDDGAGESSDERPSGAKAGEPGAVYRIHYDEYYAYRRATIAAEANITALEEEYLLMQ